MTFESARKVVSERFSESLIYLNYINFEESNSRNFALTRQDIKVMKGLFFVHLYGALEKSIVVSVQLLLTKIRILQPKNEHLILPFNVISMSRKWQSIKDTGYKNSLFQMNQFFSELESDCYHDFDECLFSTYLQNIWAKTIKDVIDAFGISDFTLTLDQKVLIDELVQKRNEIAHGRESAASVGERFNCSELRNKFNGVHSFINLFINRLEAYFDCKEFLRPNMQVHYQ